MSTLLDRPRKAGREASADTGRWWALVVLSLAQLMVVLDATIVNIALPTAQASLHFSNADRQWVVTGYALAFGSLLLLGGRLSDFFGRKRMFLIGLIGFASASALGGAANGLEMLIVARALQGAFGAALAPAALSLLSTTFTEPAERGKAFGIFGAISGAGGGIGLLLGGVLTEYVSWRWCLYVNLVIAALAVAGAMLKLKDEPSGAHGRIDVPGTIAAVVGLVGLVYGLGKAETDGWTARGTLGPIIVGVVALILFVLIERRVEHPLLPLRVVLDRNRGGSYASIAIAGAGMFGIFLFLTYYLAVVLHFTPVKTGLAFLPMLGSVMLTATTAGSILAPKVGPRPLVPLGALVAAGGLLLLTRLDLDSTYASGVLPGLIVIGLGLGLVFAPTQNAATSGVEHRDAGVASAMINTVQQIGGSIGTALLSSFAATAATDYAKGKQPSQLLQLQAQIESYHTVFWWSAGFFVLAAVVALVLFRTGPLDVDPDAPPAMAH
ncbi:multidrug MFS transporter [Actinoplanes sp. SE50]|uniref:DHA2 family efflux MFS transporter permease subunit n=1 Tax=unclassified Actinoplanes TaxID=2626549 RepID=UPI00023EC8FD|nr:MULTISPECIES: DHA2 family efflux MFS transporter permease subunit [unclassified Actinoplanes]AEV82582.1 Puromycin resistance protein pur8 [Actinoplanes sp. SE50/110]ATO80978.1 multidrug MFS transporter [Actinoplanes sp. SE50]SLL98385.1 multidrug MFS transporter [Actinoplanes sp. SE50/110]